MMAEITKANGGEHSAEPKPRTRRHIKPAVAITPTVPVAQVARLMHGPECRRRARARQLQTRNLVRDDTRVYGLLVAGLG